MGVEPKIGGKPPQNGWLEDFLVSFWGSFLAGAMFR